MAKHSRQNSIPFRECFAVYFFHEYAIYVPLGNPSLADKQAFLTEIVRSRMKVTAFATYLLAWLSTWCILCLCGKVGHESCIPEGKTFGRFPATQEHLGGTFGDNAG